MFLTRITRRQALRGGLVAGAGLAAAAAFPLVELIAPTAPQRAAKLTYESFATQVGTQFRLNTGALLRLASVKRLQPPAHPFQPPTTGDGFVLEFGSSGPVASATYTVEHGRLGTFEMFLSPVGMPGPTATVEAVFNRLW